MQQYNYSIIIPHKNIPDLLQRCLDSIPLREDVQVIIVDDDSDPERVDFEHIPGLTRLNTEVYFDKTGRGAGRARNVGLEHVKGNWVLFADADDYFETDNLVKLLNTDLKNYEVIAWPSILKDGDCSVLLNSDCDNSKEVLFRMNEPWKKMVKYSFLIENKIKFQESIVSNDLFFSMQVAKSCILFYWYNFPIYSWVRRKNSLSAKYSGKNLLSALNVSLYVNRYLLKNNKEKYFDRTWFYLKHLWYESTFLYWLYLLIICIILGYKYAKIFNEQVCDEIYIPKNIILQIIFVIKTKCKKWSL